MNHEFPTPDELYAAGALAAIDRHFARTLQRLRPGESPLVFLAAALTSRAVQAGHVCLDLAALDSEILAPETQLNAPLLDAEERPLDVRLPSLAQWRSALTESELVGDGSRATPLVLAEHADGGCRLYLQRYARYESRLVQALTARTQGALELDEAFLKTRFERWFGQEPNRQRLAAFVALARRLALISGGPGTGKTTTVTKLLLLLQEQALQQGKPLHVLLLAPTGKAAQRLNEAIDQGFDDNEVDPALRAVMPKAASTIHRALGYQNRTPTRFFHNAERPLGADVVIVDEASMVDLALMTKLVEAVPAQARLILLGDRHQLASIEAGAIFGDLCGEQRAYSHEFAERVRRVTGESVATTDVSPAMADSVVQLDKSHRYRDDSGIGRLATALRQGDADAVLSLLGNAEAKLASDDEVSLSSIEGLGERALQQRLEKVAEHGYREYVAARGPEARLIELGRFRLLSPHRRGPTGVETLNRLAERALARATALAPEGLHYDGRPIMVTENDYALELFNGDVGVIALESGRLAAFFEGQGKLRRVQLSRLPAHETVFALTVHKSQGSEFDEVALVLPQERSPVLTRELLYTGVTRAKRRVQILGTREVLRAGIDSQIRRASGIRAALWGR